ncbi:MAG: HD domain-containing protein [Chitinispirillales bacterium]|nr:HD domain-containing protein [Chitinispirillales bacterium]
MAANIDVDMRDVRIFSKDDYYQVYLDEKKLNRELELELAFYRSELEKFKHEAAKAYVLSKVRREDDAVMSAQANKILKDLQEVNIDLRQKVHELDKANKSLYESYKSTINRLVLASEYKDDETVNHILRMSAYSVHMAELCGFDDSRLEEIEFASPMHDIGKIGIRDSIIFKDGKLTDEEFDEMKKHCEIGANLLKNPDSPIVECAQRIAMSHHEKWNGTGYPHGLKGEEIPLEARIVALCDMFDALTSKRPYKEPYPIDIACEIIKKARGEDLDPNLVDIFLANIDGFITIKNRIDATESEETIRANFKWSERDAEGLQQ